VAVPRAQWKGFMKLGSITCAVKLTGAVTESSKIRFRTLNRKTRQPVRAVYVDESTNEIVDRDQQVKGFEIDKNEYIIVEPDEIERLKKAGEHRIEIDGFVDRSSVSSVYRGKPYYLYPAEKLASDPYALIRTALEKNKVDAIGRIVMLQRERSVLIEPLDGGLVVTLLRKANEVVSDAEAFDGIPKSKVDPDLAEIAAMLIDRKRTHFDPSKFTDRYEDALIEMLEAKKKGKKPPKHAASQPRSNVTNLAALLKKSLAHEAADKGKGQRRKAA